MFTGFASQFQKYTACGTATALKKSTQLLKVLTITPAEKKRLSEKWKKKKKSADIIFIFIHLFYNACL